MHYNSKHFTVFSSPLVQLQLLVLVFGLSGSPITFTKLIRHLLQGLDDVISYLDDVLVFHQTLSEHLIGVCRLQYSIQPFGLTIRPAKTYVATTEVVLLSYAIRQGKIMSEPLLLSKIMSIQVPKTKRQVRSLLGLINFHSLFIPKYTEIVACLTEFTAGPATRTMVEWSPLHNYAFVNKQRALITKPFPHLLSCLVISS